MQVWRSKLREFALSTDRGEGALEGPALRQHLNKLERAKKTHPSIGGSLTVPPQSRPNAIGSNRSGDGFIFVEPGCRLKGLLGCVRRASGWIDDLEVEMPAILWA
jgi:hypothetical protein